MCGTPASGKSTLVEALLGVGPLLHHHITDGDRARASIATSNTLPTTTSSSSALESVLQASTEARTPNGARALRRRLLIQLRAAPSSQTRTVEFVLGRASPAEATALRALLSAGEAPSSAPPPSTGASPSLPPSGKSTSPSPARHALTASPWSALRTTSCREVSRVLAQRLAVRSDEPVVLRVHSRKLFAQLDLLDTPGACPGSAGERALTDLVARHPHALLLFVADHVDPPQRQEYAHPVGQLLARLDPGGRRSAVVFTQLAAHLSALRSAEELRAWLARARDAVLLGGGGGGARTRTHTHTHTTGGGGGGGGGGQPLVGPLLRDAHFFLSLPSAELRYGLSAEECRRNAARCAAHDSALLATALASAAADDLRARAGLPTVYAGVCALLQRRRREALATRLAALRRRVRLRALDTQRTANTHSRVGGCSRLSARQLAAMRCRQWCDLLHALLSGAHTQLPGDHRFGQTLAEEREQSAVAEFACCAPHLPDRKHRASADSQRPRGDHDGQQTRALTDASAHLCGGPQVRRLLREFFSAANALTPPAGEFTRCGVHGLSAGELAAQVSEHALAHCVHAVTGMYALLVQRLRYVLERLSAQPSLLLQREAGVSVGAGAAGVSSALDLCGWLESETLSGGLALLRSCECAVAAYLRENTSFTHWELHSDAVRSLFPSLDRTRRLDGREANQYAAELLAKLYAHIRARLVKELVLKTHAKFLVPL
jgi:hypothetical protein